MRGVALRVAVPHLSAQVQIWGRSQLLSMTTPEQCIDALLAAAERLDKSPTRAEYDTLKQKPASGTIMRVMGGWNLAKEAAGLPTYYQGEGGGTEIQPKPDSVDLPDGYEWNELNPQQRWYYKNREHRVAVKTRRKEQLREWFKSYKRSKCSCEVCGETHPACLEFHHVGEKRMGVSQMVYMGFAKDRILEEIDACRVLCSNCHRKEHYGASVLVE